MFLPSAVAAAEPDFGSRQMAFSLYSGCWVPWPLPTRSPGAGHGQTRNWPCANPGLHSSRFLSPGKSKARYYCPGYSLLKRRSVETLSRRYQDFESSGKFCGGRHPHAKGACSPKSCGVWWRQGASGLSMWFTTTWHVVGGTVHTSPLANASEASMRKDQLVGSDTGPSGMRSRPWAFPANNVAVASFGRPGERKSNVEMAERHRSGLSVPSSISRG